MPALFRRHSNIQCFFCQSPVPFPVNIRSFKCPACSCWNRFDQNGEIISDEPAMHEEHLNSTSFAKRASPSKDRLPTLYGPGPFCHSCQTNQMLIVNLLSNYLPAPESPEYQARVEMLPAYRESLHVRYPPVCDQCLPQVEEEIRQKEHMARTKALGGWLSKGKDRQRRVSGPETHKRETVPSEIFFWWIVRGCLWALSFSISLIGSFSAAHGFYPFSRLGFLHPILPLLVLMSLLWTAWDFKYATYRNAQLQGRDVRMQGKRTYNILQITAWAIRLGWSIFLSIRWFWPQYELNRKSLLTNFSFELINMLISWYVLDIQHPPSIRLVDTQSHKFDKSRSGTPMSDGQTLTPTVAKFPAISEHDALLSLSLSSNPVITRVNPIFGLPSLPGPTTPSIVTREESNSDEMDWTPTNPAPIKRESENDNDWLRPQRFFAPEKPTGLEGLFESARIQDEPMPFHGNDQRRTSSLDQTWKWGPLYILFFALLVATVMYTMKWTAQVNWAF